MTNSPCDTCDHAHTKCYQKCETWTPNFIEVWKRQTKRIQSILAEEKEKVNVSTVNAYVDYREYVFANIFTKLWR